jgi:CRISPR-associated protein Cmr1
MQTITFTCETITPMFLSGADGSTPELRPPSIKGALRFWWRAMNGELAPNEIYLNLKDAEQYVFGGVGGFEIGSDKRVGSKSKFTVRVSNISNDVVKSISKVDFNEKRGLEYFFYLIAAGMTQNNQAFTRAKFDVIITAYEEEDLLQACASFWLLTYFGGLGSRARRGAGSFEICSVVDADNILENKIKMIPDNSSRSFLTKGLRVYVKFAFFVFLHLLS